MMKRNTWKISITLFSTFVKSVETTIAPATAEEKAKRRLELKARSTLLMGIPSEYQLMFNSINNAKSLLQAVEKRLQKLVSQLEIHGESISQEDVNQKFLRSLSLEWNTHTIVWRNKPEIHTLSLDDLYNNLKIYEPELEEMSPHNRIYVTPSHTKEISKNMKRVGNGFSGRDTPLFPTMMVQVQEDMGEDEPVNEEMNDSLERAATTVTSLDAEQDRGLSEEDASKQGRIANINSNEDITLVSTHNEQMFDVDQDLSGEEVFVAQQDENVVEHEVNAAQIQVTTAATTPTISIDEATLAQALAELKHTKPKAKAKGIVFHEPEELANERAQQELEANIALIESWDAVQAKIDADYQLAERLQAKEQQELNDEEKAKLFMKLLDKKRKFFAAKRAEEKRNKPPIQAQKMCTYLKNMEGNKLTDLKNKSFDFIQKMFDRTFKRVNIFVDYRTELVEESSKKTEEEVTEGSSKRAATKLEQESVKKQIINDDKETVELQQLVKIIPDEEEVAIDAIPLAIKPPSFVD
nr:ribonuclease H-like domain-containing protein [Tanacetum cinerariifolium]